MIAVSLLTLAAVSAVTAQDRTGSIKRGMTAFIVEEGAVSRRVLFDAIGSADNRERVIVYETESGRRLYRANAGVADQASSPSLNGLVDQLGERGKPDLRRTALDLRTTDTIAISIVEQYEEYSEHVIRSGAINEPEHTFIDVVFYLRHPPVDGIGRHIATDVCLLTAQYKSGNRLKALSSKLNDRDLAPRFNDFRLFVDAAKTQGVATQAITALAAHLGWLQPGGPPRVVSLFDPSCPDEAQPVQLSANPNAVVCESQRSPYGPLEALTAVTPLKHVCQQIARAGGSTQTTPLGPPKSSPQSGQTSAPTTPTPTTSAPKAPKAQTPSSSQSPVPRVRNRDPQKQTPTPSPQARSPKVQRAPDKPPPRPVYPPADSGATPQPFNVRIARFGGDSGYRGYRLRVTERTGPVGAALVHLGPDAGDRNPNRADLSTGGSVVKFNPTQRMMAGRHRIYLVLVPDPRSCTRGATARVSLAQEGLRFGDKNPHSLQVYRQIGDCGQLMAELIFQFDEP